MYSKLGNSICELLAGLKADISCDNYIYYALIKIVVIQSIVQCCKSQLELTSHFITAHHTVSINYAGVYIGLCAQRGPG